MWFYLQYITSLTPSTKAESFISAVCRTFKAQVAHVQDGSQQLGNLPVLRLSEHEDLHGRQDAGVITQVVSTVTRCTFTLEGTKNF